MKENHASHLVQLCEKASSQRSQQDIWYIRDRLHEGSAFFRLWPAQLQQLLCRLLRVQQWVQNEVLAAAGSRPDTLCFITKGQAAVAIRSAPDSSLLKDVALLNEGDTFGELSLLGRQQHPAFVIARSPQLVTLAVEARQLARAMAEVMKQVTALSSTQVSLHPTGPLCCTPGANQTLPAYQQDECSVESLYQLIGQPRSPVKVTLTPQRAAQVRELTSRQLAEAAAAEAATVGTWQLLPHQRLKAGPAQNTTPSHPVTCTAAKKTKNKDKGCNLQGPAQEVVHAASGSGVGPHSPQQPSLPVSCIASDRSGTQGEQQGDMDVCLSHTVMECNSSVHQYLGAAPAAEAVQRHQQSGGPLRHHTAIMNAAAVKADVAKLSAAP